MLCLFRVISKTYESYKFYKQLPRTAELVKVVEIGLNFRINMSDDAKKKRIDSNTFNILDLPEQIFRKIFSYLDDQAIFNLKNICNAVKKYVIGYVEVDRRFLVLYHIFERRFAMESMHMIKFPTRDPRIHTKMTQFSLPIPNQPIPNVFATTIQQYNVIGLYYSHKMHLRVILTGPSFTYIYLIRKKMNGLGYCQIHLKKKGFRRTI